MRLALAVGIFVLVGCSSDAVAPTAPTALTSRPVAPSSTTYVWLMVAEDSGLCIADAKVEVIAGQARGLAATQTEPCDVWGYGGGIEFKDLKAGVEMTLRASAAGYAAQQKIVIPRLGPQQATIFVLSKNR
jgi:hypothetical protein